MYLSTLSLSALTNRLQDIKHRIVSRLSQMKTKPDIQSAVCDSVTQKMNNRELNLQKHQWTLESLIPGQVGGRSFFTQVCIVEDVLVCQHV